MRTRSELAYAEIASPLGDLLAATTDAGLVLLAYADERRDALLERLAATVGARPMHAPSHVAPVRRQLDEYFAGQRRMFDVALDNILVSGFSRRVLDAAAAIPFGKVSTYGQLAVAAGSPRAARAVGNALGANPLAIVVPCHRVLRSGGGLGGYTTGVDKKRFLLAHEGVTIPPG